MKTYVQVRRDVVWQESCVLRALARQGRPVTSWQSPNYWAEYIAQLPPQLRQVAA